MNIGDILKPFQLKSTNNKVVSTYDFSDKYVFLILVTCNHCPYAQAYWPRMIKLAEKFEEDNLGVVAICGNDANLQPQDAFENMQSLAKQFRLSFPYLHDEEQKVMKQLGATKTPEVFLFNSRRELVYKGAIDDSWDNESTVMSVYLDDAIEYTLDGIDIDYPEVEAEGCSIKWK
jgi:peroxiredoxin